MHRLATHFDYDSTLDQIAKDGVETNLRVLQSHSLENIVQDPELATRGLVVLETTIQKQAHEIRLLKAHIAELEGQTVTLATLN